LNSSPPILFAQAQLKRHCRSVRRAIGSSRQWRSRPSAFRTTLLDRQEHLIKTEAMLRGGDDFGRCVGIPASNSELPQRHCTILVADDPSRRIGRAACAQFRCPAGRLQAPRLRLSLVGEFLAKRRGAARLARIDLSQCAFALCRHNLFHVMEKPPCRCRCRCQFCCLSLFSPFRSVWRLRRCSTWIQGTTTHLLFR
jgi:hypothetical protein